MKNRRLALTLALSIAAAGSAVAEPSWQQVKIFTAEAGVHRVNFEELEAAGAEGEVKSSHLALSNGDRLVRLRVQDGGDGLFGPGDHLEFVADVLHGPATYYHPYARHNVYWLKLDPSAARRYSEGTLSEYDETGIDVAVPYRDEHLEKDQLLIRLAAAEVGDDEHPELWYWSKLSQLSKKPFSTEMEARGIRAGARVNFEASFRGLSSAVPEPVDGQPHPGRDHQVMVALQGNTHRFTWDGRTPFVGERSAAVEADSGEVSSLAFEVYVEPREFAGESILDVVVFDWIRAQFAVEPVLHQELVRWRRHAEDERLPVPVESPVDGTITVFGEHLWEWEANAGATMLLENAGTADLWLLRSDAVLEPVAIEVDRPSRLRAFDNRADYLMIAHRSLLEATEELAALHRDRGLEVEVIDVADVYDEFLAGVSAPEAIRSFLEFAYHNWERPRPRFVLLVGDASWDTKNATVDDANYANWGNRAGAAGPRFGRMHTLDYSEALLNNRNLVPSWSYHTTEGHAASDAYFVMVDGDDELPDLALGRLPVVDPDEVREITAKIRRYIAEAPLGPWRSRHLWITGGVQSHKSRSQRLARDFADSGFAPTMVLPGDEANPEDRARIMQGLDEGMLVTHFIGHGGRFIWRTAPPDLSNQIDLFGLEQLAELQPSERLSVVVSVSCYSAPFDHPSSDSIGEAFLRMPDRGAIGFIGASWRNAPPRALSRGLVEELSRPGTIGEALLRVKRDLGRRDSTHLFNLLGDPAVPVAAPAVEIPLAIEEESELDHFLADLPAGAIGGKASWVLVDDDGVTLASEEQSIDEARARWSVATGPGTRRATLYFWNEETGVDGVAGATLERPEEPREGVSTAIRTGPGKPAPDGPPPDTSDPEASGAEASDTEPGS